MKTENEIKEMMVDQDVSTLYQSHNPLDRLKAETILKTLRWVLDEDICISCGKDTKK